TKETGCVATDCLAVDAECCLDAPSASHPFDGIQPDPGFHRGSVFLSGDLDNERVAAGWKARCREHDGLCLGGSRVSVDLTLQYPIEVDVGNSGPPVAVAQPPHARPSEAER